MTRAGCRRTRRRRAGTTCTVVLRRAATRRRCWWRHSYACARIRRCCSASSAHGPGPRSRAPGRPSHDVAEDDDAVLASLLEVAAVVAGHAEAPARRPRWFSASWYDEVDAWIDQHLAARGRARTGDTVPVKVWSLSAVLQVPCEPAAVWFKASCRHFHAEPALTRLVVEMLPEHAPRDPGRRRAAGVAPDGRDAGRGRGARGRAARRPGAAAARIAATIQLRSLEHLEEIERAGVPERGLAETLHVFDEILVGSIELDELSPGRGGRRARRTRGRARRRRGARLARPSRDPRPRRSPPGQRRSRRRHGRALRLERCRGLTPVPGHRAAHEATARGRGARGPRGLRRGVARGLPGRRLWPAPSSSPPTRTRSTRW